MGKPFTPEALADRWDCSAETIRQMIHRGELTGFRVGRMIRIPADAVEKHECANTELGGSMAASPSHGDSKMGAGGGFALMHSRERQQKPKR